MLTLGLSMYSRLSGLIDTILVDAQLTGGHDDTQVMTPCWRTLADLADCCHCAVTLAADLAYVAIALKHSQRTWQIVDTSWQIVDTSWEDVR